MEYRASAGTVVVRSALLYSAKKDWAILRATACHLNRIRGPLSHIISLSHLTPIEMQ